MRTNQHATYEIDIYAEATQNPGFWDQVEELQGRVIDECANGAPLSSGPAELRRQEILDEVDELLGIDFETSGHTARFVGTAFHKPNLRAPLKPIGLCGIHGTIGGANTVDIPGDDTHTTHPNRLVVEIIDQAKPNATYYLPLTRSAIGALSLEMSVDVPYPMLGSRPAFIRREAQRFQSIVTSSGFFGCAAEEQRDGLDDMLSSMNEACAPYNAQNITVAVDCQSYWQITHLPNGENEPEEHSDMENTVMLQGRNIRIILPEYNSGDSYFVGREDLPISDGMPHAELIDPENDSTYWIPLDHVKDIWNVDDQQVAVAGEMQSLPTNEMPDEMDLMAEVFRTPKFIEAVEHAEQQALFVDEAEEETRFEELLDDVNECIREDLFMKPCRFKGVILNTPDGRGGFKEKWIDGDSIALHGPNILHIHGVPRVVIELGVPKDGENDETIVFFLPDSTGIEKLVSYDDDDFTPPGEAASFDLIDYIKVSAKTSRGIIQGKDFRSAPKAEQILLLNPALDDLNEALAILKPTREGQYIECNTKRYFVVPKELWGKISLDEIAITDQSSLKENQRTYPKGRAIYADIPELSNPEIGHFDGLKSFKVSRGEPMVVIDDNERKLLFFIRSSDVIGFDMPGEQSD